MKILSLILVCLSVGCASHSNRAKDSALSAIAVAPISSTEPTSFGSAGDRKVAVDTAAVGSAPTASPSSDKYFKAFPVQRKTVNAYKIDWTKSQSLKAKTYKTAFDSAAAEFKLVKKAWVLGNRFLFITPGCGSGCQAIGIYNIETGVPILLPVTASVGISFRPDSRLLVIDPPEFIVQVYGADAPKWLTTSYYVISDSGEAIEFVPQ